LPVRPWQPRTAIAAFGESRGADRGNPRNSAEAFDWSHNPGHHATDIKRFMTIGKSMARVCFILQVAGDKVDEYRNRHRTVWPEMRQALTEAGWRNYSLFLRPDGLLVGYLECDDFDDARAAMARTEVNAHWQAEMADFFVDPGNTTADEGMQPLEEVFHLP
jgi:L-rhamnose mutarotase